TRIAAGSLRDSQLLPSQPPRVKPTRQSDRHRPALSSRVAGRGLRTCCLSIPCHAKTRQAGQESGRISCTAGPLVELSLPEQEPRALARARFRASEKMAKETLTITDNRTGKTYEVPIQEGTIRATDLRQIMVDKEDFGLMTYDPAFMNTASCRSSITYIDGDKGILRYRGYPVDQLAENASYLEVAYLLINGELPTQGELDQFTQNVTHHTFVHENVRTFIDGFRYDAHPMGMLVATVSALSTFYPEAKHVLDHDIRRQQMVRLIAKMPTLAAWSFRHSMGMPFVYPSNEV